MSVTEVSLCANALRKLGDQPITSLSDDSDRARLANALYAPTRDSVLRAHPWNFAMKRVQLAQVQTGPAWGWTYAYSLPSDCLRVITTDLDEDLTPWVVEGRQLLTDASTVKLAYIAQITDTAVFDALFADTLTDRLAYEFALAITAKSDLAKLFYQSYQLKLKEARSIDGIENPPTALNDGDVLTRVR